MKFRLLTQLLFFLGFKSFAQLDTVHWIPPLHARDNAQIADHYVYLSTPVATPFTVTIKDGAGNILATPLVSNAAPFIYTAGTGQNAASKLFVRIDSLRIPLKSRGLVLTAGQPFFANVRARSGSQAGIITTKGNAAAGTTFRIGGFPQTQDVASRNFTAGIMALEDNTSVTISDYAAGVTFAGTTFTTPASVSVTLNKGECYVLSGYTNVAANLDGFIGALVQSTKPIVLNNGNLLGQVSTSTSQDMGIDQSVPVEKVGDRYILIAGNGGADMEVPIVIAHANNTQIFINGNATPIATINAGQYYIVPNTFYQGTPHKNMHISTSEPAYMYQALAGSTDPATGGLNFIPPYNCYLPNTIDLIPSVNSIGSTNYNGGVFVFTRQGAVLTINGAVQTGSVPVPSVPWVTYKVTGLTGDVKISSTSPIAAGIFGASGNAGYAGYFSGFSSALTPTNFTVSKPCFQSPTQFTTVIDNSLIPDSISWTFGDPSTGNANFSTQLNPVHTFSAPGSYQVQLIVHRCDIDTVIKTVVIEANPVANFGFGNVCLSNSVSFTDSSTVNTPGIVNNWVWDFGNSNSSTLQNPTNSFNTVSAFPVKLTVTTASGCIDSITKLLTVPDTMVITSTSSTYVSAPGVCDGVASVTITNGTSPYTYLWSSGSTTSAVNNLCEGVNSVTVTDSKGCTAQATVVFVLPLCLQDVDFNSWQQTGVAANGNWTVQMGGAQVYQSINGNPTFFVTPNDFINVKIKGKMRTINSDDDFLGFVFGLKEPLGSTFDYDMWLLDWKQRSQVSGGDLAQEGLALSKVVGNIPNGDIGKYFWGHTSDSIFNVVDTLYGAGLGWVRNQAHEVEFIYTYSKAVIIIDGDTIFEHTDCFQPGRFGFYNYSQPQVTYWDFTYELISDFQVETPEICMGDTAKFTFVNVCTGNLDLSYVRQLEWQFGDGTTLLNTNVTEANANPAHVYQTHGTFNVMMILRDFYGCVDTAYQTITVYPLPAPDFTFTNQCFGNDIPFINTSSIVVAPSSIASIEWHLGDGNTENSNAFSHTYAAGNYNVKLIAESNRGCRDSVTKQVSVFEKPSAAFSINNVCFGFDAVFVNNSTVAAPASISGYAWQLGDGNISAQQSPNHFYQNAGSYSVDMIVSTGDGCSDTAAQNIIIYPKPIAAFTKTDECANTVVIFSDGSTISGDSIVQWQWQFGDGNVAAQPSPAHTYTTAGSDSVELIVTSNQNCKDTTIQQQTVHPIPVAGFTVGPVCFENTSQFTDASTVASGSITNWNWDFDDGGTAATQNPVHFYTVFGTFDVQLIVSTDNNCVDTATVSVTVFPKPAASFETDSVCLNIPNTFTQTSTVDSGSIVSQSWQFGDGNTSAQANPQHTYNTANYFDVTLVITTDNGCRDTATSVAGVFLLPQLAFNPTDVCETFATAYNNASTIAAGTIDTYNWNFGDGNSSTDINPQHTYTADGNYTVSLSALSDRNCTSSISEQAIVFQNPQVTSISRPACFGLSDGYINATASNGNAPYSYAWNNGASAALNNYIPAGTYRLTVSDVNGCTVTTSEVVTQSAAPLIVATDKDVYDLFFGDKVPMTISTNYDSVSYNFSPSNFMSCSNCPNPIATPFSSITMLITATDTFGCVGTKEVAFDVRVDFPFYIPNTFSPNGDGANDFFFPVGTNVKNISWQVFNRWGEKVFEANSFHQKWDGTFMGEAQPGGVYVYVMKVVFENNSTKQYKGDIFLLR